MKAKAVARAKRESRMSKTEADKEIKGIVSDAKFEWLPVAKMNVDARAQRPLRVAWIRAHIDKFDVNQLGVIVISRRKDGSLWIVDGQHRVELLRAVNWGDQLTYCEVFENLSIKQEAALFLKRNDKVAVSTFAKFVVSIAEGDPIALGVSKIVSEVGLSIDLSPRPGAIKAVAALMKIYRGDGTASEKEGAVALKRALQTIVASWGDADSNFNGVLVEGIGLFHLRYGAEVELDTLNHKLAAIGGGAAGLIGNARALRGLHGGRAPYNVAAMVVDYYNRGRRAGKLPQWTS